MLQRSALVSACDATRASSSLSLNASGRQRDHDGSVGHRRVTQKNARDRLIPTGAPVQLAQGRDGLFRMPSHWGRCVPAALQAPRCRRHAAAGEADYEGGYRGIFPYILVSEGP